MSRETAFSLLLFLIHIQSLTKQHPFASGFELKKLLKSQKLSSNDDVFNFKYGLNIEQDGKAILSRGGKMKSIQQSIFRNI